MRGRQKYQLADSRGGGGDPASLIFDPVAKKRFVSRVLAILAAQLLVLLGAASVLTLHGPTRAAMGPEVPWLAALLALGTVATASCLPAATVRRPLGRRLLLAAFTVVLAALLGACAAPAVLFGLGLGAASLAAMSAASVLGVHGDAVAVLVVAAGFVGGVASAPAMLVQVVHGALGALVFCMLALHNVRRMRRHEHLYYGHVGRREYVYAVVVFYLDIYCSFLYVLSNVGGTWD